MIEDNVTIEGLEASRMRSLHYRRASTPRVRARAIALNLRVETGTHSQRILTHSHEFPLIPAHQRVPTSRISSLCCEGEGASVCSQGVALEASVAGFCSQGVALTTSLSISALTTSLSISALTTSQVPALGLDVFWNWRWDRMSSASGAGTGCLLQLALGPDVPN
jgi:hypothetical protein